MDSEKLLDKAESKGLLTKPKSAYSPKEALGLILLPGFSTNQEVTEYSGRGVGMDVVKKNVESVGGAVKIDSEYGKGTTITLKIPLTMAIVDGMKVTVGKSIFTIPIANISQSFKISKDEIILDETGHEMIERMGDFYPVIRLNRFYNIPSDYDDDIEEGIFIWVESGDKSCVLYADDLIVEQQVVVKPLPVYFNDYDLKNVGISGCTILGDGNISIILDVAGIHSAAIDNA
jgi:two-component system chemotaxis sensor kinase CheA